MLSLNPNTKIYLASGATDMRKSFDTLAALVSNTLKLDPLSGHFFVFCNRNKNRIKILMWDGSGFMLLAKRLERGTFYWPTSNDASIKMSSSELTVLLDGLDLKNFTRRKWYRRRASSL